MLSRKLGPVINSSKININNIFRPHNPTHLPTGAPFYKFPLFRIAFRYPNCQTNQIHSIQIITSTRKNKPPGSVLNLPELFETTML